MTGAEGQAAFAGLTGRFQGQGTWRDEAGDSHRYQVEMTLEARDEGLHLSFTHVFTEEPETEDVSFALVLRPEAPSILGFSIPGLPPGRGYYAEDLLHYTLPLPGNAVEVSCFFTASGCRVAGSSERNKAGRFIMWDERLSRLD
ncbi:hypothetical protein [Pseudooceanicola sp. 200-1SW]|uniref:hypothetical protein n=1 Tax=Pseudooceanicola sp. 200-1SW TaxID=3425949 RepID=UPI003D7F7445